MARATRSSSVIVVWSHPCPMAFPEAFVASICPLFSLLPAVTGAGAFYGGASSLVSSSAEPPQVWGSTAVPCSSLPSACCLVLCSSINALRALVSSRSSLWPTLLAVACCLVFCSSLDTLRALVSSGLFWGSLLLAVVYCLVLCSSIDSLRALFSSGLSLWSALLAVSCCLVFCSSLDTLRGQLRVVVMFHASGRSQCQGPLQWSLLATLLLSRAVEGGGALGRVLLTTALRLLSGSLLFCATPES